MADYQELKRLAEAAPGSAWRHHVHHHPKSNTYSHTIQTDEDWGDPVAYTETSPRSEHECAAAAFIAAANPAAVLALIAEVERLQRAEKNDLIAYKAVLQRQDELRHERDHLKTEVEALRKDAEHLKGSTAFVKRLCDSAGKQPSVATGYLHDILAAMSKEPGQ